MQFGITSELFYAWAEHTQDEIEHRHTLLSRAAMRMLQRCVVQTFEAWAEAVRAAAEARAEREIQALRICGRWHSPLLGRVFDAWFGFLAQRRQTFLRAANAIGPGRLLYMSIRTWREAALDSVRERERAWLLGLVDESLQVQIEKSLDEALAPVHERSVEQKAAEAANGLEIKVLQV